MKIAYLVGEDLDAHPGLHRKIHGQIDQWASAGHQVSLVLAPNSRVVDPAGRVIWQKSQTAQANHEVSRIRRLLQRRDQYRFVRRALDRIRPDLTYSRYLLPAPGLVSSLHNAGKVVVEINSNDRSEYYLRRFSTGIYNRLFRRRLLGRADGLIFVTSELAGEKAFSGLAQDRIIIANGMNVDSAQFADVTHNARPQICFIGSPQQAWHGTDKLIQLIQMLPESEFHIVGPSRQECIDLWGCNPENVTFHGYLSAADADSLISRMDIGVSTLALHRKSMSEACPLKMRQYLAHGLPVISAHDDPDIQPDAPFLLQLPNTENNVVPNRATIRRYVSRVFNDSGIRRSARDFALSSLDERKKESRRLAFFSHLRDQAGSGP